MKITMTWVNRESITLILSALCVIAARESNGAIEKTPSRAALIPGA
jgi:hypothetical protein